MAKKQSALELFLNTLNKMGIKYEIDEYNGKTIWFDYLYMQMLCAEEDKDGRYINLEYIDLKELSDGEDEMEEMARAEEIEKMGYLNQEPN